MTICLILNVSYELLKWSYYVEDQTHRLLSLRYIFLLGIGIFAARGGKFKRWVIMLLATVGLSFLTATTYVGYEPRIISSWTSTSFISSMWIVPLIVWVIQNVNISYRPLELFGRATYNIFLIQMIYYAAYYQKLGERINNRIVHLIAGIVICVVIGVVFYLVEARLTQAIIKRLEKQI